MRSNGQHHGRSGFSLVELLVVIGVVALILALLLPALRGARESSRTVQCLSNLRQIGLAVQTYAHSNRGFIVPGGYWGTLDGAPDPGGASWAGILVHGRYVQADAGRDGGLRKTGAGGWVTSPPDYWMSTIFHCPEGRAPGLRVMAPPTSTRDAAGALVVTRLDETTSEIAVTSYAVNCTPGLSPFGRQPFRLLPEWYPDGRKDYRLVKLSQCRDASRVVTVFDGLWFLQMFDARFVNARHKDRTVTNLLMADGHAESQPTASLVSRQHTFVARYDVRWQIDQTWAND